MGTKILEFQVGNFRTWVISNPKAVYWLEVFLEAVRGHKFQSKIFGTKCRNFLEYFRTVWVEFSELFFDSPC